jgi:hypothetical protein
MTDLRIAPDGARWHDSVLAAPDEAILCWAWGHPWRAVKKQSRKSARGIPLEDVELTCPCCGRQRNVSLRVNGHDIFSSSYTKGHRLRTGNPTVREAREEWSRRQGARAKAAGRTARRPRTDPRAESATDSTTTGPDASEPGPAPAVFLPAPAG